MIPHHIEAVESSQYMIPRLKDKEHIQLLAKIVNMQNDEFKQMKDWYLDLTGYPYQDNNNYKPMMPDLKTIQSDKDAFSTYIKV